MYTQTVFHIFKGLPHTTYTHTHTIVCTHTHTHMGMPIRLHPSTQTNSQKGLYFSTPWGLESDFAIAGKVLFMSTKAARVCSEICMCVRGGDHAVSVCVLVLVFVWLCTCPLDTSSYLRLSRYIMFNSRRSMPAAFVSEPDWPYWRCKCSSDGAVTQSLFAGTAVFTITDGAQSITCILEDSCVCVFVCVCKVITVTWALLYKNYYKNLCSMSERVCNIIIVPWTFVYTNY